jgi:hypothetical protein
MKRWRCPKRRVIPLAEQRLMAERANSQITEISGTPLDALLHPMDEPYGGIADKADRWIFVHFVQLVLTPFLAAGVWMLLEGIESIPALVARAFLALWMVFFSAVNAVAGIATGVLTRHANSLAGEDREGVVAAIDFLLERQSARRRRVLRPRKPGSLLLGGGLHRRHGGALPDGCISRGGRSDLPVMLFATHSGLGAAVGLIALFVAELLTFGRRSSGTAPSRAAGTGLETSDAHTA